MQRSSTNSPTFGPLASRAAEKPQSPWNPEHDGSAHLNAVAVPTVSRHGLQPIDRQGKATGATADLKAPGANGPDNRRRRTSRCQRMDQEPCPLPIFGILQTVGVLYSWRQRPSAKVHFRHGTNSWAVVETIPRHRGLVVLARCPMCLCNVSDG